MEATEMKNQKKLGTIRGTGITVHGDMAEASAPITVEWRSEGLAMSTPYQTADARHSAREAVRLVSRWLDSAQPLWPTA